MRRAEQQLRRGAADKGGRRNGEPGTEGGHVAPDPPIGLVRRISAEGHREETEGGRWIRPLLVSRQRRGVGHHQACDAPTDERPTYGIDVGRRRLRWPLQRKRGGTDHGLTRSLLAGARE